MRQGLSMELWEQMNRGTPSVRPTPGTENNGLFSFINEWLHHNYTPQVHPVDVLTGRTQPSQPFISNTPQTQPPAISTVAALGGATELPIPHGWERAMLPTKSGMFAQAIPTQAAPMQAKTAQTQKAASKQGDTKTSSKEVERKPVQPTAVTSQPIVHQTGNTLPMTFGNGNYAIPNTGYEAGGIYIDPVAYGQDNGGLQHADMGILHQTAPASFGQALAFANILQGHRGLSGGIGDMTRTMQDIDKMNAYQAQGLVADRVQNLMQSGYGADEARYMALTEYGLANGLDRMAVGSTMPEYVKAADEQAKHRLDTLAAMGGAYQARTGFGYTPLGVERIERNADGTANAVVNGQRINGMSPEYLLSGVYGAIKGNGAGASNAANAYVDGGRSENSAWKDIAAIEKGAYDVENGVKSKKIVEDEERLIQRRLDAKLELARQKEALKNGNGVTSGIDPSKWKF